MGRIYDVIAYELDNIRDKEQKSNTSFNAALFQFCCKSICLGKIIVENFNLVAIIT
jgi:hypothetical protein